MHIYVKNISANFHPDPVWNDGALDFFEDGRTSNKKYNSKTNSDMRSVPDLKMCSGATWFSVHSGFRLNVCYAKLENLGFWK